MEPPEVISADCAPASAVSSPAAASGSNMSTGIRQAIIDGRVLPDG